GVRDLLESLDEIEQVRCVLAHDDAADGDPGWAVATPGPDCSNAAQDPLEGAALPANAVVQRGDVGCPAWTADTGGGSPGFSAAEVSARGPRGMLGAENPGSFRGNNPPHPRQSSGVFWTPCRELSQAPPHSSRRHRDSFATRGARGGELSPLGPTHVDD